MTTESDLAMRVALKACLLGRKRWDEPPGLHFVGEGDNGEGLQVRPRSIITPEMWPPEPTMALPYIADAFEQGGPTLAAFGMPSTFAGIAFRCEAWTVAASLEEKDEMLAHSRKRQLHKHPRRVEQRIVVAVVKGGVSYMASQTRGLQEVEIHANSKMEGVVPEALQRIVAALMGGVN
jgi:hypothetical protein